MLEIPKNYPCGLASLADCIYRHLILSTPQNSAATLALDVAEAIRREFAGSLLYIGKGDDFDRDRRNAAIVLNFDGHNHRELSKRYKISLSCLYDILKQSKKPTK